MGSVRKILRTHIAACSAILARSSSVSPPPTKSFLLTNFTISVLHPAPSLGRVFALTADLPDYLGVAVEQEALVSVSGTPMLDERRLRRHEVRQERIGRLVISPSEGYVMVARLRVRHYVLVAKTGSESRRKRLDTAEHQIALKRWATICQNDNILDFRHLQLLV
jgi:hypothetical protein